MSNISIRLSADEKDLFKNYAKCHNISISELLRESTLARIEDELDLKAYEDAAFFFQEIPGCYFFLASSAPHPEDGEIYYHHNSKFCIDESVFHLGATLFYETAMDLMQK